MCVCVQNEIYSTNNDDEITGDIRDTRNVYNALFSKLAHYVIFGLLHEIRYDCKGSKVDRARFSLKKKSVLPKFEKKEFFCT